MKRLFAKKVNDIYNEYATETACTDR